MRPGGSLSIIVVTCDCDPHSPGSHDLLYMTGPRTSISLLYNRLPVYCVKPSSSVQSKGSSGDEKLVKFDCRSEFASQWSLPQYFQPLSPQIGERKDFIVDTQYSGPE